MPEGENARLRYKLESREIRQAMRRVLLALEDRGHDRVCAEIDRLQLMGTMEDGRDEQGK
jgi:hypothetical protein